MRFDFKNLLFLSILVLLIFIPLYPKFPLFAVAGTYVAVRMEDILVFLVFGIWVLSNLKNYKNILDKNITRAFLLFWGIGLLSVISGILVTNSVKPHLGILHWLRRVEYMGLFLVAASVVHSRVQLKSVLYTLFIVNLLVVLYGLGQIYFQFPVVSTTNREYSKGLILTLTPGTRPNSTFAGHYDLAAFLSLALVFLGGMFFYYRKIWQKGLLVFAGILSFALLGLTAARVSFVGALAGLTGVFWLSGKKILIVALVLASCAAVVAVPQLRHRLWATVTVNLLGGGGPKYSQDQNTVNEFTPKAFENGDSTISALEASRSATPPASVPRDIAPGEPVNPTELGVYRSFNIRTQVEWPRAIRSFYKNIFLGTGYSSITIATDNDFLRSLGETGLLGTSSLVLIFYLITKRMFSSLNRVEKFEKYFLISALCGIFVVLITGTFIDILEASKIAVLLWVMLGVAWGVSGNMEDEKDTIGHKNK